MEQSNEKDLELMCDFMLKMSMITGNAHLEIKPGHRDYLVNVRNNEGLYLSYHTNGSLIDDSNGYMFQHVISADGDYYNNKKCKLLSNDESFREAILGAPIDMLRTFEENGSCKAGTNPSVESEKLARSLSRGEQDEQLEKLKKLLVLVSKRTGNASINTFNGNYYITTQTKKGKTFMFLTNNQSISSGDSNIFNMRKLSEKFDTEKLPIGIDGEGVELIQHDATLDEIEDYMQYDEEYEIPIQSNNAVKNALEGGITEGDIARAEAGENRKKNTRRSTAR